MYKVGLIDNVNKSRPATEPYLLFLGNDQDQISIFFLIIWGAKTCFHVSTSIKVKVKG